MGKPYQQKSVGHAIMGLKIFGGKMEKYIFGGKIDK
jgi:hypothetical protein